jgi:hypothetical protein
MKVTMTFCFAVSAGVVLLGGCAASPAPASTQQPVATHEQHEAAEHDEGHDKHDMHGEGHDKHHMHGEGHDKDHDRGKKAGHHDYFPAAVNDFHDVLAPLWHTASGPERVQNTCAAAGKMHEMAQGIASDEVPAEAAENADAWRRATADMTAKAATLHAECSAKPEAFTANFTALHEAFHEVIKLIRPKNK